MRALSSALLPISSAAPSAARISAPACNRDGQRRASHRPQAANTKLETLPNRVALPSLVMWMPVPSRGRRRRRRRRGRRAGRGGANAAAGILAMRTDGSATPAPSPPRPAESEMPPATARKRASNSLSRRECERVLVGSAALASVRSEARTQSASASPHGRVSALVALCLVARTIRMGFIIDGQDRLRTASPSSVGAMIPARCPGRRSRSERSRADHHAERGQSHGSAAFAASAIEAGIKRPGR